MTKARNPLFSLNAHGTLADTLTIQKVRSLNIIRKKPELPYSRTLPQNYHRWLYQDYLELWRNETDAVKATYRTLASRYNSTPVAQYMKEHLPTLKHLLALWTLDGTVLTVGNDYSPNNRNLDLLLPTSAAGPIALARLWDGVNDHARRIDADLDVPGPFTICFFGRTDGPKDPIIFHTAYRRRDAADNDSVNWWFEQEATGLKAVHVRLNRSTPYPTTTTSVALPPNLYGDIIHWALVLDTYYNFYRVYMNGIGAFSTGYTYGIYPGLTQHYFGNYGWQHSWAWNGLIDHLEYWDIALPASLLKLKSARRYP